MWANDLGGMLNILVWTGMKEILKKCGKAFLVAVDVQTSSATAGGGGFSRPACP